MKISEWRLNEKFIVLNLIKARTCVLISSFRMCVCKKLSYHVRRAITSSLVNQLK